ncbi:SLC13 family permease [Balneolaceae bacterium YR4-1]|uniref:SLC13 family permease n=1 Tax=Halalkalibaculum roseum TaxID=2709311 RepID=A0A6M1SR98_9BACT|nr:SLC13 family permease [Halalkalibaculum roseum]NGP75340.1 SLC13 family permease [Halalkalibaculum roseum]
MSLEIIFVLFLLVAAFFLFATDYVSFDVAAMILLFSLLVTGILDFEEGLSGISHPATVAIASMFVLSEGLRRTGLLNKAGDYFSERLQENFYVWMVVMMLFISGMSAIMNNTAVVIIFIPILIEVASKIGISASKLLMPVSFAAIMGGICTLIGTSTNLLVASIAEERGAAAFSMFDFTPVGVSLLVVGYLFLLIFGINMIPARRSQDEDELTKNFEMQGYLADVVVEPNSDLVGGVLDEEELTKRLDLDVLRIMKPDRNRSAQRSEIKVEVGDVFRIRANPEELNKLLQKEDFSSRAAKEWFDVDLEHGRDALIEAIVTPESSLEGKSLNEIDFYERFGAVPLAIRHKGELQHDDLGEVKISGGDSLLLSLSSDRISEIEKDSTFVVASKLGVMSQRKDKTFMALSILLGVVLVAAFEILPIAISAGTGVILMILTGCITTEEAYQAVNWKIIMLLAGVIPLGLAMDKTGAASLLAEGLIETLQGFGPRALLGGFYLLTMLMSAVMSTNASAALVAPLAIQIANSIGVNPEPFVISVSYAASLTFLTPFGHHANTLIYGAGQYKFTDFTKVGLPINILFWALATYLIPVIWPF